MKVVCNHTGSNMLMGVAAAFVLNAGISGKLDADHAVIEIDEASTVRVFPHFRPDLCVLTNLFRDQLDRYGEIDITMNLLRQAFDMAPDMKIVVNGDDSLSTFLAQESGHPVITYGISERVKESQGRGTDTSHEIREGQFCKRCGTRLEYDFYHYSQLGVYHCPNCGFQRPLIDYDACHIELKDGLRFDISERFEKEGDWQGKAEPQNQKSGSGSTEQTHGLRHIHANYRGFYNIYNVLACYAAVKTAGIPTDHFDRMLDSYHPENGRNEQFQIGRTKVLLNLAKNPAGFNQNISSVMEDTSPKDLIIVINDNAQDGRDISWLWDVDFDRLKEESIRSITVSGLRCQDMRLRLKYVSIQADLIADVRSAIEHRLKDGCGNLYVLVNYTALYSTHNILKEMEKG
jgi:UDP-N-acetylmuramyl tripeptide synthase